LKWTFAPLTNSTLTAGDLPIYGSTLVATTEQGLIYAFEISNGQVVWHMRTEYKFFFSPIIVGQNLLLYTEMQGGQKWNLTPVQLKTLEVKDPVGPYELPLSGQPLRTPNALIFATQTGHLTAIDLETLSSKAKWSAVGSSGFRSSPAEFGDRIYIGNEDGIIVVYDKRNGKKMNEIDLGSNLQTPLKFKESANMGAVVDTTGNLSTFDPKKRAWKFNLGASAANMPVELYQLSMHSLGKLSFNSDVRGWSAWAPCQSTHLCIFDLKKGAVLHRIDLQAAMGSRFAIFNDALWVDVKDKDGFWLKKFVSRAQATEGSGAEKRP
jgi:WD40 repeat protein